MLCVLHLQQFFVGLALFVVVGEVARLAEALRVYRQMCMFTRPSLLLFALLIWACIHTNLKLSYFKNVSINVLIDVLEGSDSYRLACD